MKHKLGVFLILFFGTVLFWNGSPGTGIAKSGRDFFGWFRMSDVVVGKENVTLSFVMEVTNHSGSDIFNANLHITPLLSRESLYESSIPIDLADKSGVLIQEAVLVLPRQDYELWEKGNYPNVTITYLDGQGYMRSRYVELIPLLLKGEFQP